MTDDKVYSPEVIEDNPLPNQEVESDTGSSSSGSKDTYAPKDTKDRPIPRRIVAQETIGSALNTKARKIMATFTFTEMGAVKIGKYVNGVSGELSLTPAGMTALNTSGDTTFAIDGETGNAVFAGELRSGTLVTGEIVVGNNTWIISGDPDRPSIKLFNSGICEIVIGEP